MNIDLPIPSVIKTMKIDLPVPSVRVKIDVVLIVIFENCVPFSIFIRGFALQTNLKIEEPAIGVDII